MLVQNNIEVKFKNVMLVLEGVTLQVEDEALVCLLGNNGAGKSTTLKAISGLIKSEGGKVTKGRIEFDGKRIDTLWPEDIVRMGIVQVIEGRKIIKQLTSEENLRMGAYARKGGVDIKKELDMVYGYFPPLKHLSRRTSGYLSGGEQQMLVIGRAMMASPKLMLLDEPSLGLAPMVAVEIFRTIKKINEERKTAILLVEQNAAAALDIASYGYLLETGRLVMSGPSHILKEDGAVKEFYLGFKREVRGTST